MRALWEALGIGPGNSQYTEVYLVIEKEMNSYVLLSVRACSTTLLSLKSLCGGGVPSSHPSLGLSVFFLFTLHVLHEVHFTNGVIRQ